jgi:hypothetical protein
MIVSRPRNAPENEPDALAASSTSDLNRVGARSAFVIDIGDSLRRSVIEHLKKEGWIVHGIKRAEQALPLLRNVPYQPRVQDAYELAAPFAAYGIRGGIDRGSDRCSSLGLPPILVTSFAFILGVLPLVIAKGAGTEIG